MELTQHDQAENGKGSTEGEMNEDSSDEDSETDESSEDPDEEEESQVDQDMEESHESDGDDDLGNAKSRPGRREGSSRTLLKGEAMTSPRTRSRGDVHIDLWSLDDKIS